MSTAPSFVSLCQALATQLGITLEEAERQLLQATQSVFPSSNATFWSSVQRSLIQSVGKYEVGGDIIAWISAFESSVELSCGDVTALPFDKVEKLLYSCVSNDVQRYLRAIIPQPTTYAALIDALRSKYGKSIRQVQFELRSMQQGQNETVQAFFDRLDKVAGQAQVSSNYIEGILHGALLPAYRNHLAAYEAQNIARGLTNPLTYAETRDFLVTWEKQLVSSNGLNDGSTVNAAFGLVAPAVDVPGWGSSGRHHGGPGGGSYQQQQFRGQGGYGKGKGYGGRWADERGKQ